MKIQPFDEWAYGLPSVELPEVTDLHTTHLLPYLQQDKYVIYIEDEANPLLNNCIQANIDLLNKIFSSYQLTFIYLPDEIKNTEDTITYFYPQLDIQTRWSLYTKLKKLSIAEFSRILFSILDIPVSNLCPGLLVYDNKSFIKPPQKLISLSKHIANDAFISTIIAVFRKLGYREVIPQACEESANEPHFLYPVKSMKLKASFNYSKYDGFFSEEDTIENIPAATVENNFDIQDMAEEVKEKIRRIKQEGCFELLIHILGQEFLDDISQYSDNNTSLSQLVISDNLRIFLPEYNNLEIKLTPLPKAIYILFLRHPEGIRFKDLPSYRKELFEIYKYVSERESWKKMNESIDSLTDPTKNAINEKCSRIREAFVLNFDESLSQYYYITGKRGELKKVNLPPQLIQLPNIINRIPITAIKSNK
jgi:hypothetical protein